MLAIEIAVDTSDGCSAQLREGVLEVVIGRLVGPAGIDCTFRAIEDEALAVVVGNDASAGAQATRGLRGAAGLPMDPAAAAAAPCAT